MIDIRFKTDGKLPIIAASDIGRWALAAFKDPESWIGEYSIYIHTPVVYTWKRQGYESYNRMADHSRDRQNNLG